MNKGFSLVEMILYAALLSVFLVVLSGVFVSSLEVKLESEATSAVEQDGRYILAKLLRDATKAEDIVTPSDIGNTGNQLQLVLDGDIHTYQLNGNDLRITNSVQGANLNSNQSLVSDLSFVRLGNDPGKNSIRLNFTVTSVTQRPGGPETRSFQTTIGLR